MMVFVWEDDRTLVVLAESPEQARELVRAENARLRLASETFHAARLEAAVSAGHEPGPGFYAFPEVKAFDATHPWPEGPWWDGDDEVLDMEPYRTIVLDQPSIIAFNAGRRGEDW